MTSPEVGLVTEDKTATARRVGVPPQAGVVISTGGVDDAVERAYDAAVRDSARLGDLLDALARGRLWLPLARPVAGRPPAGDSSVQLPTVRYLGAVFVPGYTSSARLARTLSDPAPAGRATVVPHAVVPAAHLARLLPPGLGIALNPGDSQSVPVYPPGVAHLAAEHATVDGRRVSVGPLAMPLPRGLLASLRTGLGSVRAVNNAAAAWLAVQHRGEGLVISIDLVNPADPDARDAAVAAVQHAVNVAGDEVGWPVDVTFPGEGEPDVIDRWITTRTRPFYQRTPVLSQRAPVLPAPRSPTP
jgi:hypothetical protein